MINKQYLWFLIATIIAIASYFVIVDGIKKISKTGVEQEQKNGARIFLPIKEFDFGEIKQSGPIVSKDFEVKNDGTEDVVIEKVLASCSCTTGKIDNQTIRPGETATLTVSFDPNYHFESYDQIMRTVTIYSNAANDSRPEMKIYVKVDYDLGARSVKF